MTPLDIEARAVPDHRRSDDRLLAKWLPVLIQIAITLLSLGVLYGRLAGELELIKWRIGQVERQIAKP